MQLTHSHRMNKIPNKIKKKNKKQKINKIFTEQNSSLS